MGNIAGKLPAYKKKSKHHGKMVTQANRRYQVPRLMILGTYGEVLHDKGNGQRQRLSTLE